MDTSYLVAEKRPVKALVFRDILPAPVGSAPPVIEWVSPLSLLVDEAYQRGLSERSLTLIFKIVSNWNWNRFKPPVCARTPEGLEVIDGQHTAISAATHPDIDLIPVLVVDAETTADRAKAFMGHNRDRLNVTVAQLHFSAVAAGDDDALTIQQVCERAGVRLLKNPPASGGYKAKDCVAFSALKAVISRRGAMGARKILQACADANLEPVRADHIRAAEQLLHDPLFAKGFTAEEITLVLVKTPDDVLEREAKMLAFAQKQPVWKALAAVIASKIRKKRGGVSPMSSNPPTPYFWEGQQAYCRQCTAIMSPDEITGLQCGSCGFPETDWDKLVPAEDRAEWMQ